MKHFNKAVWNSKYDFLNPFVRSTLYITYRFHGKLLPEKTIQTWRYNKYYIPWTEKWDSLVLSRPDYWMIWRCYGIPCFPFYFFCLKPTVRKGIWMRTTSITVMVIFQKCHSENYMIAAMFKVRSQQLRPTLTRASWKASNSWRFYGHGSTCVLILSLAIIMKGKLTKVPGKLSIPQKSEPALRRTLHQYRR